jgi:hypothetical protein
MYVYVLLILVVVCSAFLYVTIKSIVDNRNKKLEKFTEQPSKDKTTSAQESNEGSSGKAKEDENQKPKANDDEAKQKSSEKETHPKTKDSTQNPEMEFSNNNVEVKKSCMGDRGAFATKDIKKGEIVEVCPVILEKRENVKSNTEIDNYVFSSGREGEVAVAFGYCSLFNHDDEYNVEWQVDPQSQKVVLKATQDINKGDEMFISYGKNYWKSRDKEVKSCHKKDKST